MNTFSCNRLKISCVSIAILSLGACASSPSKPAPNVGTLRTPAKISSEMKFTDLRTIGEERLRIAKWQIFDVSKVYGTGALFSVPLTGQFVTSPSHDEFVSWCELNGGWRESATTKAAAFLASNISGGYTAAYGCKTPTGSYGYADSYTLNELHQIWLDPEMMAKAGPVIAALKLDEEKAKAKAEAEAAAKNLAWQKQRALFLKGSPGTTLSCVSSVITGGLGVPLMRARMECGSFKTNLGEMLSNGWKVTSQFSSPEGDFGGHPAVRYDIVLAK